MSIPPMDRTPVKLMRFLPVLPYILLYFILFAIELLYFVNNDVLHRIAGITWYTISVLALGSFVFAAFLPLFKKSFWKEPHIAWFIIIFILPTLCTCVDLWGMRFSIVDGEGICQMLDARRLLDTDPAYGIYSVGYLRYPARSIIINYLPNLIFPPSITLLRLSTTFVTLFGGMFFIQSIRIYLKEQGNPIYNLLAAFAGSVSLLSYFSVLYLRKFDLTNAPLGGHCLILGALLLNYQKQTWLRHAWVMWALCYLAEGYTPAWGALLFSFCVLAYQLVFAKRFYNIGLILYGVLALCVSYLATQGTIHDKLYTGPPDMTSSDWVWRYFNGLCTIASVKSSLIPAPLFVAVAIAILIGLKRRNVIPILVSIWAFCMIAIAMTIAGSNFDSVFRQNCKCLIILPALALTSVLAISSFISVNALAGKGLEYIKFFLRGSLVYMCLLGAQTPFLEQEFLPYGDCWNFAEALIDVNNVVWANRQPKPTLIYLAPGLDATDNLFHYFLPDIKIIYGVPNKYQTFPGETGVYEIWVIRPRMGYDTMYPSKYQRPYLAIRQLTSDPISWDGVPVNGTN